jgi:hypothetical protein
LSHGGGVIISLRVSWEDGEDLEYKRARRVQVPRSLREKNRGKKDTLHPGWMLFYIRGIALNSLVTVSVD